MVAAAAAATTIPDEEVADEDEDAEAAEEIIMIRMILKNITCYKCDKKGHYYSDCKAPKKNGNENSNMVSKADFKNLFRSSIKEMLTKREKQKK
jgi:ribosomal protein L13